MADLLDGILNYLEMESTGALMVSGEWGCGKTYHIEKKVIPTLIDKGYNPVKVSLFGIESVNEIPLRIAENYKSPNLKSGGEKSKWPKRNKGNAISKVAHGLSSIKWLENFVDVKSLVYYYETYKCNVTAKECEMWGEQEGTILSNVNVFLKLANK